MFQRLWLPATVIFAWGLAFSNCKTSPPAADDTPPTVKFSVVNKKNNARKEFIGDGAIDFHRGDHLVVTALGEDPEGVVEITLQHNDSYTCLDGSRKSTHSQIGSGEKSHVNKDAQGQVLKQLFVIEDVDLLTKCSAKPGLVEGTMKLGAVARNVGGKSGWGELGITFIP